MKYKIDIEGMHCSGCEMLIKMSLEEANFTDVEVSLSNKSATFMSPEDVNSVKSSLDTVFSTFDKYKYSNLEIL